MSDWPRVFVMTRAHPDVQSTATGDLHRAQLAVSEAIVSHRDMSALFHELGGRLHQVVQFDALALVLHEAASGTVCLVGSYAGRGEEHSQAQSCSFSAVISWKAKALSMATAT